MLSRLLDEMPLSELFEWYAYHCCEQAVDEPKSEFSVDDEVAVMRGMFGG